MNKKLHDVLSGNEENYLLPFFWQHGEDEAILRTEMARVHEAGIGAVCIEARPHPDYLGPQWWADVDVIMDEAKSRGMRVWILDDDHFPTGHAAGKFKEAPPELRRLYLYEKHVDAIGPRKHSAFLVNPMPYVPGWSLGGTLAAVIAVKRDPSGNLTAESLDLTANVVNGKLYWDVPEGYWRIFSIIESEHGGDPEKSDYMNYLVADSVRVLIDTVYEAFYDKYKDDFGKTLAGFFSDEPGFYNDKDTWDFNSKVGKIGVTLPWSKELYSLLEEAAGADYRKYLPLLWHGSGENVSPIRYSYMNLISKLYGENFTNQIGNWCREHGVEYIGHVLEDNNVHARLGSGAGHFYRALGGQDMSGLDVVLWQLRPGFDDMPARWQVGDTDSEFFNYGMAKMAVSLAHLDPKKKGRTMAEVFGAYGWAEGLKLMKWMTDHMLVRGVNYFVPHAFSPKEFPDRDCPPHLYARGKNPQYRYYKYLNRYTNRMSHLLSGGTHVANAAVLYHAEAEWSGEYMYFHKPVKELLRHQIDCDVLPCDAFTSDLVGVRDGKLSMQAESFDCLIIPYSEVLPCAMLLKVVEMANQGLPTFFIDALPSRFVGGEQPDLLDRIKSHERIEVVQLERLAERMRISGFIDVEVNGYEPFLRCYHASNEDMDTYMFFNEHPGNEIDTEVYLPIRGPVAAYDAYNNKVSNAHTTADGQGTLVKLRLHPSQSIVLLSGAGVEGLRIPEGPGGEPVSLSIEGPWQVSTATSEQYPMFTPWRELETLTDVSQVGLLPSFSGTYRYESDFEWSSTAGNEVVIDLGEAFETAEVFVNGQSAGVCISAPYRLDISEAIQHGRNALVIEVTNTLVVASPDVMWSPMAQLEPSGLLGPISLSCTR